MATLQTRVSRRVGGKEYVKSELVIPRELVQKLSWSDDQTVDFKVYGNNKLLLIPTEPTLKIQKPTFESFAAKVVKVLGAHPQGLTWSKIRELGELEQITPNPTWVYRLEKEYDLERFRSKALQTLWRLNLASPSRECRVAVF